MSIAEIVSKSRQAQGLPPRVADAATLATIARLLIHSPGKMRQRKAKGDGR